LDIAVLNAERSPLELHHLLRRPHRPRWLSHPCYRRSSPPYRNGEELSPPPGLPLGLIPDATYAETTLHLALNDTLTFQSDGVVEARDPSGVISGCPDRLSLAACPPFSRFSLAFR
jgi:hypothetical protein